MPREENGPIPQQEEFGPGQPKLADLYRSSGESLDRQQLKLIRAISNERRKR